MTSSSEGRHSPGRTSTSPSQTLGSIMRRLREGPRLWHAVRFASGKTTPQQYAPVIPPAKSPTSHQRSPPGRQPCCSHQPPTSHRPPARWRFAGGSMTSVASFLAAAFAMPVCSAADHTPSGSTGHSSVRGAGHQVVIGARARWPNCTDECSGHT